MIFSRLELKIQIVLVVVVLLAGIGIRLYDLTDPPLDFHMARQLRSALIARSVYYSLHTAADPGLRVQAQNLAMLEVYEPPILEQIVGFTYYLVGSEQVWMARIWNALFWAVGGLALFALALRMASFWAALAGLGFYLFLPFSVIASRSFQPDPWMVMWILLAAWALDRWGTLMAAGDGQPNSRVFWKWTITAGLLGGMAVLVKVFAVFFVGAMSVCVMVGAIGERDVTPETRMRLFQPWIQGAFRVIKKPQTWILFILIIAPALAYYLFLQPGRSGSFISFWVVGLSKLLVESTFYAKWLAMVGGLMGLGVFMAALIGVLLAPRMERMTLIGLWIGYALFGFSSPYQYITHEYYHLALVGLVGVSLAPLFGVVFGMLQRQSWLWQAVAVGAFVFAAGYSLWVARSQLYTADYRSEPAAWKRIGDAIPPNRPFIALTADYGMRLRYYGWRTMADQWPSSSDLALFQLAGNDPMNYEKRFGELTQGKELFVITAFNELDLQPQLKALLDKKYPVFLRGDGFLIYELR